MAVQGKGFFIWKIPNCEAGNPAAIASAASAAGLTHVLIKIADGNNAYNYDTAQAYDRVPPVVQALRSAGMQVWGWHFVYGNDPLGEARIAIQRLLQLNLDGYVIDAESQYTEPGKATAAARFMTEMRSAFPSLPMSLASFRYPSYHPQFPWKTFLDKCDYNMPQVYWEQVHNPATQLARSVQEFKALTPYRPVLPIGPTYKTGGWAPTENDITEFLNTAKSLNLSAVSFFSWDECRRDLPKLWPVIANYAWTGSGTGSLDLPYQYISALNKGDAASVANLYAPTAVHINAARTVQGQDAIKTYFATFLNQLLPKATFTLTGSSGTGGSRNFTWQASSSKGVVRNGSDTIGLLNGKISYHYTFFTITPN